LHSSRVSPTEAGVPVFWKGTAVTRRLRSSALSRRTDRVQNPQAPSNTRVRCCGRPVKVINLIVPLSSDWTGTGASQMAELRRILILRHSQLQKTSKGGAAPDMPHKLSRPACGPTTQSHYPPPHGSRSIDLCGRSHSRRRTATLLTPHCERWYKRFLAIADRMMKRHTFLDPRASSGVLGSVL
jgi:hypothetical protein